MERVIQELGVLFVLDKHPRFFRTVHILGFVLVFVSVQKKYVLLDSLIIRWASFLQAMDKTPRVLHHP